jgi:hypothetical protein
LMSCLMCAFPYPPLSVLVVLTSVFLISCVMATLSALCLDPLRLPLLYFFSSALDRSRILPLFGPAS